MIKTVIRVENDMVMVFDENGEAMPDYQGYFNAVRYRIVADAPADAVFNHWFGHFLKPHVVKPNIW